MNISSFIQFQIELDEGNVTLDICLMLKDEARVERLITLYECYQVSNFNIFMKI